MNPLLPTSPGIPGEEDRDAVSLVELRRSHAEVSQERWRIRAAQWQAAALAQAIFGAEVEVSLDRYPGRGGFHGLLHLRVPFLGMDRHLELEREFCVVAGGDPVLSAIPLLFVFQAADPAVTHG